MKSIAKIGRKLISVFLVVVVSTLMFLTSPALAANWITVNTDNLESEVLNSDKTTVVLLVSNIYPDAENVKAKLKSEVEKTYGDKYQLAVGSVEENGFLYTSILAPRIYPPYPGITVVKNGDPLRGIFIAPTDPSQAFEFINDVIANS
ncbi:hypothetical protein PCC7424_2555 [Gloeothece citriformis PCC 7424]|uniref:DUF4174 domain-containing protein n=1 Tax=Gloeothece citriformis (strain PCC 7424) TaxID=65393 RepID=B7KK86_GLOC7|nr:hypothetical protein [Gloeothece citriformis]ACK70971.1 hypothetical protein PCC7424_2555 [Gloeothece citriformis PCC 7424]